MARKRTSTDAAPEAENTPEAEAPTSEAIEEIPPVLSEPSGSTEPLVAEVERFVMERQAEKAEALVLTPAPEVAYYRVTATCRFVVGGQITELREGSVLSTITHRIEDVRAQNVPLVRCAAPHTVPSPHSPTGYMMAPSHDFSMEEPTDPLLAAAMGSDR